MSKKHVKSFLFLLILLPVILIIGAYFWWTSVTASPSNSSDAQSFVVTKGKGASQIANDLYEAGLIKSPLAFKFYVQLTGRSKAIGAGEFEIARNLNMFEVLQELSGGPLELWVTIPEGYRKEEVAERFIASLEIPSERQMQFRSEFLDVAEEGYLFPDTYLFPRDISAETAVERMKSLFNSKTVSLKTEIESSDLSLEEIVTLASIVERETKSKDPNERPTVAGILLNRLEIGMALQADATAQYAVANVRCKGKVECNWWVTPLLVDLEVNSPYNTYRVAGLPPAPIASPGLSAIEAVINPIKTDYLYYIHEPDGTVHYAETLEEHNANVTRYLR